MGLYDELTGLYPVQKTLRWELKPVGKTKEYMVERDLIKHDEHLAESYKGIKKIIDRMHKAVIEESLTKEGIDEEMLLNYESAIVEGDVDKIKKIQQNLRKDVVALLKKHEWYPKLFKKDILDDILPKVAESELEYNIISEFKNFYTILTNYNEVRKNLYSDEEKHSTIAYRLINENLPRFFNNIRVYEKLSKYDIDLSGPISDLKAYCGEIDCSIEFGIKGFNKVLCQAGIDRYNEIIGGVSTEDSKIQGFNEIINLWNQKHKEVKLPKFLPLYKQILTESKSSSFKIDEFKNDEEIVSSLIQCMQTLQELLFKNNDSKYDGVMAHLDLYDTDKIYIKNSNEITQISKIIYDDWSMVRECISKDYDHNYSGKKKYGTDKYEEEKKKELKKKDSYSLKYIFKLVSENGYQDIDDELGILVDKMESLVEELSISSNTLKNHLNSSDLNKVAFIKNNDLVYDIKRMLDNVKNLLSYVELFKGSKLENNRDEAFYGDYAELVDGLTQFNGLYNKVRNYFTKKPFSTNKIALHFNAPTLLDGWDVNKEEANLGVIFIKDEKYYLGIMDSKSRNALRNMPEPTSNDVYKKMEYKLLPGPNKMLPKVFFSKSRIDEFAPSEEVLKIRGEESFKKGDNFDLDKCHSLIDFYKESLYKHPDWHTFNFKFKETKEYQDISEFYREVSDQGYKISFKTVDAAFIDNLVNNGKMYLYQIYSKDFSKYSKGNLNLQTIYWNMIFDERNRNPVMYKLNGEAEVFYRKASLKLNETTIHKAGDELKNKNPLNKKHYSKFDYDLIKNKRYTQDKLFFHCPITVNFVSKQQERINELVRKSILKEQEQYIIGIDRGERNLLYVVVINSKGEIVDGEQISLNMITSKAPNGLQKVDYHDLLNRREKERDKARKNWGTIEQIRDLKTGYLSQAVHVVSQLAVKYNAIIVLEDLNMGFMRGRQKIEKQVYQNFERMLIQKLNLLVTKKDRNMQNVEVSGGALHAYQLTNKFDSLSKIGRQTGVLFYIPAWNTSKIDPTTGFVNLLSTKYETMDRTKSFIQRFDFIRYNKKSDYFEFGLDYNQFTTRAMGTQTHWTLCTVGKRLENRRNKENNNMFETQEVWPVELMKDLLAKNQIDYVEGNDLKDSLCNMETSNDYKEFMRILRLTLQIRNSKLASEMGDDDYLQSCVMNKYGKFFNSEETDETLPQDADANGAYNIARKGLMIIDRIKSEPENERINMAISNKDWLNYAQEHC